MNESIVSPWIVYSLFNLNSIFGLIVTILIPSTITTIIILIGMGVTKCSQTSKYYHIRENGDKLLPVWVEAWKKIGKKTLITTIICILFLTLTPNKNTIIAMYAAKEITFERVNKIVNITKTTTKELHKTLKQDVLDIITSISKQETSNTKEK